MPGGDPMMTHAPKLEDLSKACIFGSGCARPTKLFVLTVDFTPTNGTQCERSVVLAVCQSCADHFGAGLFDACRRRVRAVLQRADLSAWITRGGH